MVMTSMILPVVVHWMVWSYSWWCPDPVVKVDYVAQLNELRKPAGYRVEDDGTPLFVKACSMIRDVQVPEFHRTVKGRDEHGVERELTKKIGWPGDLNDAEVKELKGWLAANDEAFGTLERAMEKKCFWLKMKSRDGAMINVLTEQMPEAKYLVYGFLWRGKMKAWEGDTKGGLRDAFTAANIGKCFGERPNLIEWSVGVGLAATGYSAARQIALRCSLSSEELAGVAVSTEEAGKRWYSLEPSMDFERLTIRDEAQRYFTDDGLGNGVLAFRRVGG